MIAVKNKILTLLNLYVNRIQDKINDRIKIECMFYSVKIYYNPSWFLDDFNLKIYKKIVFPVVSYGYERGL